MGRMIRRIFGTMLLCAAVVLTAIPFDVLNAASYVDSFQMDHSILDKYTGTATAVSVPDDVTSIAQGAFYNMQGIYSVDLGYNTVSVGECAFAGCTDLNTVTMHDSMEKLDSAAFSGCINLTGINLGAGLTEMGYGVFAGCTNLSNITISPNNDNFKVLGGGLYSRDIKTLYAFMNGHPSGYVKIPDTVEEISKYVFWGNRTIDTVSLSTSMERIPAYSFSNCINLKAINIPYSVNTIDAKAFENCDSLYDIIIPPSVTYIAPTAFDGCSNLNIVADEGTAAYEFFQNFKNSNQGEKQDISDILQGIEEKYAKEAEETIPEVDTQEETGEEAADETATDGAAEETATDTEEGDEVSPTPIDSGNTDDNTAEPTGDGADFQESITNIVPGIGLVDASRDPSNVEYMPFTHPIDGINGDGLLAKTYVVGGRAVLFVNPNLAVQGQLTASSLNDSEDVEVPTDANNGMAGAVSTYTYGDLSRGDFWRNSLGYFAAALICLCSGLGLIIYKGKRDV